MEPFYHNVLFIIIYVSHFWQRYVANQVYYQQVQ